MVGFAKTELQHQVYIVFPPNSSGLSATDV